MSKPILVSLTAAILLAGCAAPKSEDPLETAALQASRAGTIVSLHNQDRTDAAVQAGSKVAERYYFIAKYKASEEQRQVAESTARRVGKKARPVRSASDGQSKPMRYIAVKTKPDARAKSKTNVMIWDTQSEEVVGNDVYDLNAPPPDGTVIRFDTFSAEYVAAGK